MKIHKLSDDFSWIKFAYCYEKYKSCFMFLVINPTILIILCMKINNISDCFSWIKFVYYYEKYNNNSYY